MTKVIVDIPNPLHRMIKSIAVSRGESMKNIIMQGLESLVKKEMKTEIKTSNDEYITEEEADKMLRPYLLKMAERIDKGEEKLLSWKEVKKQLKK